MNEGGFIDMINSVFGGAVTTLIGAFTGIASIVPMTMVIEGNTQASNADAAMTNPQDAEQLRQIAADLKASADQQ